MVLYNKWEDLKISYISMNFIILFEFQCKVEEKRMCPLY
jgi:hypothetical protein